MATDYRLMAVRAGRAVAARRQGGGPGAGHRTRSADFRRTVEALTGADLPETRARRGAYCADLLLRLEARRGRARVRALPAIQAELAMVRDYFAGECLLPDGCEAEAIRQGEMAVREAEASGIHWLLYDCLINLGGWYLILGDESAAVTCFQRALAYSGEPGAGLGRQVDVLCWLGGVWCRNPETLPLARLTAEWRRNLQPWDIESYRDEHVWLIRHQRNAEVEAVIVAGSGETCAGIARYAAALLASGRYEEAVAAAREGRSRALAGGEHEWARAFDRVLTPAGPALQGR
ncbi:MAG: hypothetical protein ACLQVD_09250 [Capsulimonadaceae bacterium]